jgi:LmbE family N-acetylglucosaminyl deacetylase
MAPLQVAVGRAVKIIREIKPDVVITHDTGGGYGHPDHIATHNITIKAFQAAGGQGIYPEAGPVFQPKKLYFAVYPRRLMKIAVRLMPLFGQDPHHFGRNKDVDLTEMMGIEHPVHAVISLQKRSIDLRKKAIACHASQSSGEGRPGPFNILGIVEKVMGSKAYYMRAFPPATRHREKDLFEGIT